MNFLFIIKGKLQSSISYIKTHMSKSRLYTIGGCAGFVLLSALIGTSFAGTDENAWMEARQQENERRMQLNSEQYGKLAPQKARNEARCTLAKEQEKQMTQLNIENNSLRRENEFLNSLLTPQ